ncbi:hypothetical protein CDAR_49081 [Caerostris darwini]|uniref:Uncharacterized protein n=1 Tax=Caerostris darwini TaxID=1538125 RepID=A0AAV4NJ22_9ARAC|nr:hypothetical protein CDAR_49081 [Caerostris darwini]
MSNYSTSAASKRKLRNSFVEKYSEGNVPNSVRSSQGIAISVLACFLERAPSIPAGSGGISAQLIFHPQYDFIQKDIQQNLI